MAASASFSFLKACDSSAERVMGPWVLLAVREYRVAASVGHPEVDLR